MMKGIRKLLGLFLGVTLAAGTVTMPVNAEGENQESKVKITPTEIVADGVFNNGGYGSLMIYGEDDHDNFQVIKAPQAALIDREGNFVFPYKETRLRYYYDNGIVSLIGERPYLNYTLRGLPDPVGFYNLDGSKAFELDCFGATKMVDGLSFVQNVLNREDVFNSVIDAYIVDRNGNRVYTFDRSFCDVIGGGVGTFDIDELYSECSAAYFGNGLLLCWENEGGCRIFYVNAKGEV